MSQADRKAGSVPFRHHTVDEAPVARPAPWGGISKGATASDASERLLDALHAHPEWPSVAEYLREHRAAVGVTLGGRNIATVICRDGRSYDVNPGDAYEITVVAEALIEQIQAQMDLATMLPCERYFRRADAITE